MLQGTLPRPLPCARGHSSRPCSLATPAKSRHLVIANYKPSPPASQTQPSASGEGVPAQQDVFQKTIDLMLNRAASSLKRGASTCVSCRGGGTVECAHCKGGGRLSAQAAERAGLLRTALLRLRTAVGLAPHDVPYASSSWMQTNRCPRCHGVGRLACEPCTGTGLRFPHQQQQQQGRNM
ncbi:hypothetical protein PLESTB_000690700 [Pleodorina starrii]|uniref:Uncharacterized protein n=1 Tax=Pleodorina starrii TaxID=330485 RepID=A0A9W6BJW5_9CHLO|nr:hypothetical protein PLESTM_001226600 [Pleodorina starrii]GLC52942.1 hypothetical protein PLESTB_000690700 [Pleodorina starrii]GLC65237.1 hypothetical protein PLESTF_000266900 [Pleodorina starrii]